MKPSDRPRCGYILEKAGVPCMRPLNHPSPDKHLSQNAIDGDLAKQVRYYRRDRNKRVTMTLRTEFSVREDLREYAESSGRQLNEIIETALVSYLRGSFQ